MLLLVGLGNPGPDYANNRHNIGFMALDEIARRYGFAPWREKFQGLAAEGRITLPDGTEQRLLALKPMTYMNLSGGAVGKALQFYKIAPADMVVFHDELDIAPGRIKVKKGGGAGGHNGLRSIDGQIGPDYWRVRLGIGHPGHRDLVLNYVLGNFAKTDQDWLQPLFTTLAAEFSLLAAGQFEAYASRVVAALTPAKQTKEA